MNRAIRLLVASLCGSLVCGGIVSCDFDALHRVTASLGGDTAGNRGTFGVVFINNTPYRAIFTFGAYDDYDRDTVVALHQFSSDEETLNLEGNTQTGTLGVLCSRVLSIGGAGLIARVHQNMEEDEYHEPPLVNGVWFSSADKDDDLADVSTEGTAAPLDAHLGVDFECGALLIYRFEINDAGPEEFIVELSVIAPESTRG